MNSPEDARLKKDFERVREEDQRTAPSFAEVVAAGGRRAPAIKERAARFRMALAAVPILAVAAGAIVAVRLHPAAETLPPEAIALAGWKSPTAFLLEIPGREFLKETPQLGVPLYNLPKGIQDAK